MPKNTKCRRISSLPGQFGFVPADNVEAGAVQLTFDEFETIRLLDAEGLTQEKCAEKMGVARTTVTAMYDSARKKIAKVLVEGRSLVISGGNVRFSISQNGSLGKLKTKGDKFTSPEESIQLVKTIGNINPNEIDKHMNDTKNF
jgi:predicted DNA-binding protein (UPF0251 family)